jgi:hypothetical protein
LLVKTPTVIRTSKLSALDTTQRKCCPSVRAAIDRCVDEPLIQIAPQHYLFA